MKDSGKKGKEGGRKREGGEEDRGIREYEGNGVKTMSLTQWSRPVSPAPTHHVLVEEV